MSGSGNAKTETVQALDGIGATVTSTISSTGALLSATSQRERSKDATGGLLRKLGDSGVLVVKDVTSILSMSREMRGEVLGAMREVYDGRWSRHVGTDGGQTLDWTGRLVVPPTRNGLGDVVSPSPVSPRWCAPVTPYPPIAILRRRKDT